VTCPCSRHPHVNELYRAVQERLSAERGQIWSQAPQRSPTSLGFYITAFTTLDDPGDNFEALGHLRRIPHVLEAHFVAGDGTLRCRLAARSYRDLLSAIQQLQSRPGVRRSSTAISLEEIIPSGREIDEQARQLADFLSGNPNASITEGRRVLGVDVASLYASLRAVTSAIARITRRRQADHLTAFATLKMDESGPADGLDEQRGLVNHLRSIPEVSEAHLVTGSGDIVCQLETRGHSHLQRVIAALSAHPSVVDSSTAIALRTAIEYRTDQLLDVLPGQVAEPESESSSAGLIRTSGNTEPLSGRSASDSVLTTLGATSVDHLANMMTPVVLGYELVAFTRLEIDQDNFSDVLLHLNNIPQVVEGHWVAGNTDMICTVVATDNSHLLEIIGNMCSTLAIVRPSTSVSLETVVPISLSRLAPASSSDAYRRTIDYFPDAQRTSRLDPDEQNILRLVIRNPAVSVAECASRLGLRPVVVEARLLRLSESLQKFTHEVSPAALGYPVAAFCALDLRQRSGVPVQDNIKRVQTHIRGIPEVLDAHLVTGDVDLLCRVAARDNAHLSQLIRQISSDEGTAGSTTMISLETVIPYRLLPLIKQGYLRY
jgi:DNA-binding Lrp family transcriptional regulator